MVDPKDLFLDTELQCGGFFELAIQFCPSIDNEPIRLYTEYIWTLDGVSGPFDKDFRAIPIDFEGVQHHGLLRLGDFLIPFMTFNVRETEPIETGFNWFDICFYTAAIEHVFGPEYLTWTENPKVPQALTDFSRKTVKALYQIFPFQFAMVDFEVSGQYYLESLSKPLPHSWATTTFYVGQDSYVQIDPANRTWVHRMEDL